MPLTSDEISIAYAKKHLSQKARDTLDKVQEGKEAQKLIEEIEQAFNALQITTYDLLKADSVEIRKNLAEYPLSASTITKIHKMLAEAYQRINLAKQEESITEAEINRFDNFFTSVEIFLRDLRKGI